MKNAKKNTNKKNDLEVSINDIINYEDEGEFYRDIFKFIMRNFDISRNTFDENYISQYDTSFRVRELVRWLLDNNRTLIDRFRGSKVNKSNRAQSSTSYVVSRLDRLIKIGLMAIARNKIKSKRNKNIETDLYGLTSIGYLIAITLL